jgi:hypothetical protein
VHDRHAEPEQDADRDGDARGKDTQAGASEEEEQHGRLHLLGPRVDHADQDADGERRGEGELLDAGHSYLRPKRNQRVALTR